MLILGLVLLGVVVAWRLLVQPVETDGDDG